MKKSLGVIKENQRMLNLILKNLCKKFKNYLWNFKNFKLNIRNYQSNIILDQHPMLMFRSMKSELDNYNLKYRNGEVILNKPKNIFMNFNNKLDKEMEVKTQIKSKN